MARDEQRQPASNQDKKSASNTPIPRSALLRPGPFRAARARARPMAAFLLSPALLFDPGLSFVLERVDKEHAGGGRAAGRSSEGKIREETERNDRRLMRRRGTRLQHAGN